MEIVAGKEVYTTLEEIVDPAHTALIVVDLQNDFCGKGGLWDRVGLDLGMVPQIMPNVKKLIEGARGAGVQVVYIKMTNTPELSSMSPPALRAKMFKGRQSRSEMICPIGSWGAEILPEIAPQPEDLIVNKWRYSAFLGTPLDEILRARGIKSVVLCGATTSVCVETTARDAFQRDYYVVLGTDCVADVRRDWHNASLLLMQPRIDQVTSGEIVQVWARGSAR